MFLSEELKELYSLRSVTLNFRLCKNLSDQALRSLIEILQGMSSLEFLNLNFGRCEYEGVDLI